MAGVRTHVARSVPPYRLTLVHDRDPRRSIVCAVGEFDLAARDHLAEVLRQQADAGRRLVRLDVSRVTFLDCSCLGVIVAAHLRFLESQGLLVLTGVGANVAKILEVTGLDRRLVIVPPDADPFASVLMARAAGTTAKRRVPAARASSESRPTAPAPDCIPATSSRGRSRS